MAGKFRRLHNLADKILSDVQEAEAVLALQPFVHRAGGQIDPHRSHIDRNCARALNNIREQKRAMRVREIAQRLHVFEMTIHR